MALQKPVRILKMASPISQHESDDGEHKLGQKQINGLYASYTRMREFTEQIRKGEVQGFGKMVNNYSNRLFDFEMTSKSAMHILDKRIQRMLKNKKVKKNWSDEDTKILLWTLSHYAIKKGLTAIEEMTSADWAYIAQLIPGATPDSCMFKVLSLKHVRLSQKKWSEREESLLTQIVSKKIDKNWRNISQQLYKRNTDPDKIFRSSKQCKEHWICYLDSSIKKGPWDVEEDRKLLSLIYANNGAKKWAEISRVFKGRTENALKNRYTLIIQRLKKESEQKSELSLIRNYLEAHESITPPHKTEETVHVEHRVSFRRPSEEAVVEEECRIKSPEVKQGSKSESSQLFGHGGLLMNAGNGQFPVLFCAPGSFIWLVGSPSK